MNVFVYPQSHNPVFKKTKDTLTETYRWITCGTKADIDARTWLSLETSRVLGKAFKQHLKGLSVSPSPDSVQRLQHHVGV